MKISPKNYAQSLVKAATSSADLEKVASNFIDLVYKNKQQKDLKKILDLFDEEFAKAQGLELVKVYSEKELSAKNLEEIKIRCEQKIGKKILIKSFIDIKKVAGVVVEINGMVYDFSLSGRLENFKQQLISIS